MMFLGSFADAFLEVLAIIGIILVGGFVIFFLGDLVLSVLDPDYVRFGHRRKDTKEEEETKEPVKQIEAPKEETPVLDFKFEDEPVKEEVETPVVIEQGFEEPVAEEERDELAGLREEEEAFRANMLKAIEERRQRKAEEEKNDDLSKFFFDDEDIDVFENDEEGIIEGQQQIEEPLEEITEEETEEVVEPVEVATETVVEEENKNSDAIASLTAQFEEEIARLKSEKESIEKANEKLTAEKQELANMLQNAEQPIEVIGGPTLSLEEYEERLETLKDRLVANDKDLRKVKKEFIPLRRVNKTLESDEKKLRRREAIVAKQKVILYGVNNIVDIDEEKAKKLAEDLDLLEGLRLSVQHCEEVMNANKDRYPILENTFEILTKNQDILKKDIAETEEAIAKLKADNE